MQKTALYELPIILRFRSKSKYSFGAHYVLIYTPSVLLSRSQLVRAHVGPTSGVPPRHFDGEAEHRNGQTQKRADDGPAVRANNAQSPIGTPASKSGASVPDKPSGANHKSTIEREPLPYVWTCILCKAATRQRTMRKLREWRSNHIAYSHKTERQQVNMIKRRITILTAADLPQDNAGWVCAFCNKGIPHAPQNQLRESARSSHGTRQKRPNLVFARELVRLQKRRHPRITASSKAGNRMSLASTRRRVANNIQEIEQSSGHQLVYYPDQRRQKKSRRRLSCSRCYGSWTQGKDIPDKCANFTFNDRLAHPSFIVQWKKLRTMKDKNLAPRVPNAWKLSPEQVSNLEEVVKTMVKKRHGKLPSELRSWKRRLTEEGIEPSSGPSSLITIHSLNVDGKHRAWKFMNQFVAERKEWPSCKKST